MPGKRTLERARRDRREGKPATTQAGEFVREEMEHVKEGKHGAASRKQAIAIGLSQARRAGVDLPPPQQGRVSAKSERSAQSAYRRGQQEGSLKKSSGSSKSKNTSSARGKKTSGRKTTRRSSSSSRRGSTRSRKR